MREELRPGVYLQTGVTRAEWEAAVAAEQRAEREFSRADRAQTAALSPHLQRYEREKEKALAELMEKYDLLDELEAKTFQEAERLGDPDGRLRQAVNIAKRKFGDIIDTRLRMETTDDGRGSPDKGAGYGMNTED